jgi:methylthioribose-1-phosphate isomerase
MKINQKHYHSIWLSEDKKTVQVFDQRLFPHEIKIVDIKTSDDAFYAIKEMIVRGAPLIGVTAAYGMYLAALEAENVDNISDFLKIKAKKLKSSRPTAVNLMWAVDRVLESIDFNLSPVDIQKQVLQKAEEIKQEDIEICSKIGDFGLKIIEDIAQNKKGKTVNILTHCNAGWLATIDWGTATAPIYKAFDKGIDIHVWVDETRPRNQGSNLTAFELGEHGVKHTLITDNAGGHLMQHGLVDMVIVGTDRTTRTGDVANKIGTYLKALAAKDNGIPFYVALPSSTIDWDIENGIKQIPIELRSENEVKYVQGKSKRNSIEQVLICPENTPAANYGFDVTPARLVTKLITERGMCDASEEGLKSLFPEKFI